MADGQQLRGIPPRYSALRDIRYPMFTSPAVGGVEGFKQGVTQGANLVAQKRQLDMQEAQQKQAAAFGRMDSMLRVLENKNIPPSMKVDLWNQGLVPAWESVFGGPGSGINAGLSPLSEWPDALGDVAKQASKILGDKKLGADERLQALSALQVEAGNDIRLAPLMDRLKEERTQQLQQDTWRVYEFMSRQFQGAALSDEDKTEWLKIRTRNPAAMAGAADLLKNGLLPQAPEATFRVPTGQAPESGLPSLPPLVAPGGAAPPATPGASLGDRIGRIDAEIQSLMGQQGRPRFLGGPDPAAVNQRISQLHQMRNDLVQEQQRGSITGGTDANEIAGELFNKPFSQLTTGERARVNQTVTSRRVAVSAAQGAAAATGRQSVEPQEVLPPSEAAHLGVPYGTQRGQAFGRQPLTPQQEQTQASVQSSSAVIDRLSQLLAGIQLPKTGTERFTQAPGLAQEHLAQSNQDLVLFDSLAQGTLAPIIRSLGEKGTLAEGDVKRAIALIPNVIPSLDPRNPRLPDTEDVARGKLQQLRELLGKIGTPQSPAARPAPPTQAPMTPPAGAGEIQILRRRPAR